MNFYSASAGVTSYGPHAIAAGRARSETRAAEAALVADGVPKVLRQDAYCFGVPRESRSPDDRSIELVSFIDGALGATVLGAVPVVASGGASRVIGSPGVFFAPA